MAENRAEILAGAAVLAVAIGFLGYAFGGKGLTAEAGTYPLKASFRSVEGITAGSDVRLAGVKVGTITDLRLNPQTFFADATMESLVTSITAYVSGDAAYAAKASLAVS